MVEYKVVQARRVPISEKSINHYAEDRWRLITVVPHLDFYYYYFERDITEILNKLSSEQPAPW